MKINQFIFLIACIIILSASCSETKNEDQKAKGIQPDPDNAQLMLPEGFSALKVADSVGTARHLVVNSNGDVFVKLRDPKEGSGIIMLSDEDGDGKAETQTGFGNYGGTGITLKDSYLYASSNTDVFRYQLDEKQRVLNPDLPDTIITGLIDRRQHNSKSLAVDNEDNIYVNIGAFSNACQETDRTKGSPGMTPCPVLDSAGGIWRFNANLPKQTYENGSRYATGLRNVVGLDWNPQANMLFVMQHGRDMLHDLFPDLYDTKTSAELPAEAMYSVEEGDDFGWPYIYYDHIQKKKILSPEYGGDGKKVGGENAKDPIMSFPAHIAPNALLFYTGEMFPERYRNGAFIAFHGSWNRAPEKQEGYLVAFAPFTDGKPTGEWEIFADGFAGTNEVISPGDARHRPCGLAQGPDGSLYVSDDAGGSIYRIIYQN